MDLADGRAAVLSGPTATAAERVARRSSAETFAGDIRQRARLAVVSEQEVANKITAIPPESRHHLPEAPSIDVLPSSATTTATLGSGWSTSNKMATLIPRPHLRRCGHP